MMSRSSFALIAGFSGEAGTEIDPLAARAGFRSINPRLSVKENTSAINALVRSAEYGLPRSRAGLQAAKTSALSISDNGISPMTGQAPLLRQRSACACQDAERFGENSAM